MTDATPDLEEFRRRARSWLAENLSPRGSDEELYGQWDRCRQLQRELYAAGFAGVCYPKEYGGLGLPHAYQRVLDEESMAYEMPLALNVPTLGIIGPTILDFGTEAQKRRFLPPMLRGEHIWVQFLSEPTSGSDLASVTTRATPDGDAFVVNGSKVWSSGAYAADYAICVTRTNWSVPKHDGITVLLMKVHEPGVTVERIVNAVGDAEFCQEFFDDARVPAENVLGEVDAGWTVVQGLLAHERNCVGGASIYTNGRPARQSSRPSSRLLELAISTGQRDDPHVRQCVGEDFALSYVQGRTQHRVLRAMETGRMPPAAGALLRLMHARFAVRRFDLALEIAGGSAAAWHEGDPAGSAGPRYVARQGAEMAGGTTEMQRNIISERLLGMPRELAADRGVPFDQVRHNAPPRRAK